MSGITVFEWFGYRVNVDPASVSMLNGVMDQAATDFVGREGLADYTASIQSPFTASLLMYIHVKDNVVVWFVQPSALKWRYY